MPEKKRHFKGSKDNVKQKKYGSFINIVKEAMTYYDKRKAEFESKIEGYDNIKQEVSTADISYNKLHFYKGEKKLLTVRISAVSFFSKEENIWIWAWAHPTLNKNFSYESRKLLKYGLDKGTLDMNLEHNYIKTYLITSRLRIIDDIQFDILVSISSYLSKKPIFIYHEKLKNLYVPLFILSE